MDYKGKIRENDVLIDRIHDKLHRKGVEIKQTLEHKEYRQPKREYEQSQRLLQSYKRQAKNNGITY